MGDGGEGRITPQQEREDRASLSHHRSGVGRRGGHLHLPRCWHLLDCQPPRTWPARPHGSLDATSCLIYASAYPPPPWESLLTPLSPFSSLAGASPHPHVKSISCRRLAPSSRYTLLFRDSLDGRREPWQSENHQVPWERKEMEKGRKKEERYGMKRNTCGAHTGLTCNIGGVYAVFICPPLTMSTPSGKVPSQLLVLIIDNLSRAKHYAWRCYAKNHLGYIHN